jgi:hypothetical protein
VSLNESIFNNEILIFPQIINKSGEDTKYQFNSKRFQLDGFNDLKNRSLLIRRFFNDFLKFDIGSLEKYKNSTDEKDDHGAQKI